MSRGAIAAIGGLAGLALYLFVVLEVAMAVTGHHWALDLLFFAAAGILWALPAARLIRWVQAGPPRG
jgi:hypothetical protein